MVCLPLSLSLSHLSPQPRSLYLCRQKVHHTHEQSCAWQVHAMVALEGEWLHAKHFTQACKQRMVVLRQEEDAKALVDAMVEANGLELLVQRMVQFNEKLQDDATAVFNSLNIIENLVEVDPKVRKFISDHIDSCALLRGFTNKQQVCRFLMGSVTSGPEAHDLTTGQ